jgi:uncharacterized membrane protein
MAVKSREGEEKRIVEGKVLAILSYLSILCIIPLLFKKDNAFILSHGKQGLVLFIGEVAVFILSIVFPGMLRPGIFILLALSFVGIIAVLRGRFIELPVIARLAEKITL